MKNWCSDVPSGQPYNYVYMQDVYVYMQNNYVYIVT